MSRKTDRRAAPAPRLFGPEELALRPTGMARLRRAARRPSAPASERVRRIEDDRKTMGWLREYGTDLARRFKLRPMAIDAERDGVNGHYGICYDDGLIRIRLRHARTGRPLKESSLVDTLCHELAHLRYLDHSERFHRLYRRILDTARRLGYYRPGPQPDGRPVQLGLFDERDCGTIVVDPSGAPRAGDR